MKYMFYSYQMHKQSWTEWVTKLLYSFVEKKTEWLGLIVSVTVISGDY